MTLEGRVKYQVFFQKKNLSVMKRVHRYRDVEGTRATFCVTLTHPKVKVK